MLTGEALMLISTLAPLLIFFIVHIFYTQKVYSQNKLTSLLIFSFSFPLLIIVLNLGQSKEYLLKIASVSSIFLIYYLLLILLKKNYKKLNSFLIFKKWVDKKYARKDFTFVYWDNDGLIPDYWDEKLSSNPSWLDKLITFMLLILPVLFIALIHWVIEAF